MEASGAMPKVHAASVVVIDAASGHVLHEINADQPRPVASTQKLLTSLIVAEAGNLEASVRVQAPDTWAEPTMLYIKPGEVYRRYDLLRVLLVKSENDVARCLARDNAGSVEAFAARMNARAAQLGMTNSHFVNPNGLPAPGQHSCARDMGEARARRVPQPHHPPLRLVSRSSPGIYPDGPRPSSRTPTRCCAISRSAMA